MCVYIYIYICIRAERKNRIYMRIQMNYNNAPVLMSLIGFIRNKYPRRQCEEFHLFVFINAYDGVDDDDDAH